MLNPYEVLGVSPSDSEKVVKSKYRELTKRYHPDNPRTANAIKFDEVVKAWEELQLVGFNKTLQIWGHNSIFTVKRRNI